MTKGPIRRWEVIIVSLCRIEKRLKERALLSMPGCMDGRGWRKGFMYEAEGDQKIEWQRRLQMANQ